MFVCIIIFFGIIVMCLGGYFISKKFDNSSNEYKRFIIEKPVKNNRVPKVEAKFYNPKINELKNKAKDYRSRFIQRIRKLKTYYPKKQSKKRTRRKVTTT